MTGIQSSLYTAAIALCAFSAGILRDRQGRTFAWFTLFLCVATLGFVFELLMVHPAAPLKALWLGLRMGISLLIAPCLWLAVRESVEGIRPRLTDLGRAHWVPIAAGFVLLLPLIGSAHFGTTYSKPPGADRPLQALIHETMLLCIGIFAVQVPYYLWQSRRLLAGAPGASKWLQLPLFVVLTTWALGLLRTLQCMAHAPQALSLLFALADVGVTAGALYLVVRRGRLVEVPPDIPAPAPAVEYEPVARVTQPEPSAVIVAEPVQAPMVPSSPAPAAPVVPAPAEPKYSRSSLDAATSDRIRRKLEAALARPETCCDSLLNLRSLSQRIGEKAHYVSQVINQDLCTNFYELVNRHRIAQAKRLLMDAPDQTVLEIALAVGFNSKSTFNTAFRRHTGMTPTEYRDGQEKR
jgi:AraC-like DNA-binding protein